MDTELVLQVFFVIRSFSPVQPAPIECSCTITVLVPQPQYWEDMLTISNYVFVSIFACEALLKMAALTPKSYIADHWNKFDLFVVVISIVTIPFDGPGTSVLRMMRILRIFRLVKRFKVLAYWVMDAW